MKKISIFIIVICSFFGTAKAQDIASLFTSMPEKMLLPMDSSQRLDIIDLYRAGRKAEVVSLLGESVLMTTLQDNYLQIKSGNSTLEMALLPMINDSKITCVIRTVCAPVCDSRISFYTTEWKPLDAHIFITPVTKDWFIAEDIDKNNEYFKSFESALDMDMMQLCFEENGLSLIQTYTTPQYLSPDIRTKADKYLKHESKRYIWNKVRFE